MDTAVDDFLKEINELVPPKPKISWKECFDEASGFSYYWNTETDEVSWEPPAEYRKRSKAHSNGGKLFIPPPSEPKFNLSALPKVNEVNVKIYKINEDVTESKTAKSNDQKAVEKASKGELMSGEKITLISSYGSDSESEEEADKSLKESKIEENSKQIETTNSTTKDIKKSNDTAVQLKTPVSLVPFYANDSEEDSESEVPPSELKCEGEQENVLFPAARPSNYTGFTSGGILFPNSEDNREKNTEQINEPNKTKPEDSEIDVKAFQRKRRIGVSLINVRKPVDSKEIENSKSDGDNVKKVEYPGFKSGGIMFGDNQEIKEKPIEESSEENSFKKKEWEIDDKDLVKEIEETRGTLDEKLKFLCEGHREALPVQIMIIQMETLYGAMRDDSLKPSYLKKWLASTLEDLTKLEKEAAPDGWLLQWDRTHKRYYYCDRATGASQWEYPSDRQRADGAREDGELEEDEDADGEGEEDDATIRTEEAMDISTTPPHPPPPDDPPAPDQPPPPPPAYEKVVTPPPPIISKGVEQPLPPGVEDEKSNGNVDTERNGSFSSELNSFYSDIAAIESNQPQQPAVPNDLEELKAEPSEPPVKKKRKVKVSSGLTMKKRGVSQLVEKWKNLQKNYD